MTLGELVKSGRLQPHRTSAQEIAELFLLAERAIADARVEGISTDLRFLTAYDAALALATLPLHCAGYRTRGVGHHATTFEVLPMVMGEKVAERADLFEACRTKRNVLSYRRVGEVSVDETRELLEAVVEFRDEVRKWLRAEHPELMGGA